MRASPAIALVLAVAVACAPSANPPAQGTAVSGTPGAVTSPTTAASPGATSAAVTAQTPVAGATAVGVVTVPSTGAVATPTANVVPAVYTANTSGNSITLIDPVTRAVLETINVGFPALSVAVTPDGRYAYIVAGPSSATATTPTASANVVVFDLLTKTQVTTIQAGKNPSSIAMSPDGATAFVANAGSNNVSVIDTTGRTVTQTIPVGTQPSFLWVFPPPNVGTTTGAAAAPATGAAASSGTPATALTPTTGAAGATTSGATTSTASPSGFTLYVVNQGSHEVSVIQSAAPATAGGAAPGAAPGATSASATMTPATFGVVAHIPVGASPIAITGLPNGTQLFVANQGSGDISVIDATKHSEIHKISLASAAGHATATTGGAAGASATKTPATGAAAPVPHLTGLAMSPNGHSLFVTMDKPVSQVADVDVTAGTITKTIPAGTSATGVTFSADGGLAFVVDQASNSLIVIDATSGNTVQTVEVGQGPVFGMVGRVALPAATPAGASAAATSSAATAPAGGAAGATSTTPAATAAEATAMASPVAGSPTAEATAMASPSAAATAVESPTVAATATTEATATAVTSPTVAATATTMASPTAEATATGAPGAGAPTATP